MAGELEAIGEVVGGTMVARAVEPDAGEGSGSAETCLNCGAQLQGPHCHQCGQPAHLHRTLSAFLHDLAHSVAHLDGKIWRTLPLLAWHPGRLTRRYIEGQRASFVSPMALFLFSVFLMFAVFSAIGGPFADDDAGAGPAEIRREFQEERAQSLSRLQRLSVQLGKAKAAGEPTSAIEELIAAERRDMAAENRAFQVAFRLSTEEEKRNPSAGKDDAEEELSIGFRTGWPSLDHGLDKAEKNPSLLLYKIQANAYKFSWALIPLSVPFVWLLFLHRRRYREYGAYDHVVFVTYSIAFMSLGLVMLALLRVVGIGEAVAGLAITFIPPIHMYRQLRGAYALSRFSAAWRTVFLLLFAAVAGTLFLLLLIALGVHG